MPSKINKIRLLIASFGFTAGEFLSIHNSFEVLALKWAFLAGHYSHQGDGALFNTPIEYR
jgi:hypothetical protein